MWLHRTLRMEVLKVDPWRPQEPVIARACGVLNARGVIAYPTDTVYGIGCILQQECVGRVYRMKGRDFTAPLSVAFADVAQVRRYTKMTPEQEGRISREYKDGTTFILEKKEVPDYVTAGLVTVGVRIPDSNICRELILKCGPLISTSANPTGQTAPSRVSDMDESVKEGVDLVLDGGPCRFGKPSKVIDLTQGGRLLRR
jgi:L-threonylcarbamoyladenylate synthase